MSKVVDHLRRASLAGRDADLTDGQLLESFLSQRDEEAITALVRRHGPMVWGVCRRVLRNHQDAEDAFQATFLVFIRKAASVWPREMVANFLYGVAHQTALKARAILAKRQSREKQVQDFVEPEAVSQLDLWRDLQPLLDQELSRLPAKYRVVIILCDLESKSRKEVAQQLKIPEGTLSSRLTTARALLAKRLARHRLPVSSSMLAAVLGQKAASTAVPTSVVSATIKAACLLAAGNAATGITSIQVAALMEGVLKHMLFTKLKIVTVVLVMVAAIGGATGLLYRMQAEEPATGKQSPMPPQPNPLGVLANPKAVEKNPVPPVSEGTQPKTNKLKELLKERLQFMQAAAERMKQARSQGRASDRDVLKADLGVYRAKLELCETVNDRISILEKIVEMYRRTEELVSKLRVTAGISDDEFRAAQLQRLEGEIELEREKAKLAPPTK